MVEIENLSDELDIEVTPEQNLWLHVLLFAIYDAQHGSREAMEWLFIDERKPIFRSFWWVCSILDLDHRRVRFLVEESFHSPWEMNKCL